MLVSVLDISKAYGDTEVLNRVSLTIAPGQKVGLVGANGAGKSTLLKLIAGELEPDGGQIRLAAGAELGYLPQTLANTAGLSVEALLDQAMGSLREMEASLRALEAEIAANHDDLALLEEYGRLADAFERRGGYEREQRMAQVMAGLGLDDLPHDRLASTLSGGEKVRAGLAGLLLASPDLLLLDEPTNHLDFSAIDWLEEYLHAFHGGMLVVSHDREFLNRTVDAIVEIDEHSREAKLYAGSYDFYAQQKGVERARWEEDYARQQEEIIELRKVIKGKARQVAHGRPPRDKDKFLATFKAERVDTAVARNVRAAEERLRRIEEDPIPRPPRELRINPSFDPQAMVSNAPLVVSGVEKRYGPNHVLAGVDLTVDAETRAVIVGPNGAGKSTLLKIIAGLERPDAGSVSAGGSVVIGRLDQEQETLRDQNRTALEAYKNGRSGDPEEMKAELLGYGLFTYPELLRNVSDLSVGQKRKLQIACLIARQANLLLLDEPTNHVSMDVLERFEQALLAFRGPIIAVSHDRHFIRRFANEIWEMSDGRLQRHLGGWDDFVRERPEVATRL